MAYENDILTRNDNDELAVRTVQSVGDNPASSYDDIYTRDNNGKLCVRVTGAGGGGSDPHNLGWYATQSALETAHPTADDGDWAIVGSTDTVWVWDSDNNEWKDTDQKGQVESVNGQTGTVVLTASDVGAATTAQGAKADTAVQPGDLATVATTGSYTDLTNTPTIPAAQVNSDWNSTSGISEILNKPTLATVATSGSYDDLTDKPTIPAAQVNSDWDAVSGVAQILNKPTLGTAASANTTDFATAAQGALAATAVQPGDLATVATTGNYSDLSGTPTIPAPTQVSALPTAGADELGNIYQFVGTTDANYTNGYFYKCVSDGQDPATYSWEQTDVMPAGSSLPDQTGQSGKFLTTDGTDTSWADISALQNTATGTDALTILGTAATASEAINIGIGSSAYSSGIAIGNGTSTGVGAVSIGKGAAANGYASAGKHALSVAIGEGSSTQPTYNSNKNVAILGSTSNGRTKSMVAIAGNATCSGGYDGDVIAIGGDANNQNGHLIQLGDGTNTTYGTFQVWSYNLLNRSDGTIPTARLTKVNTAITLAAADWSSNTQTVNVTGMTATGVVMVSPDPADQSAYTSAGILCTAQAAGSLTFTCDTVPSGDIDVNVVCL